MTTRFTPGERFDEQLVMGQEEPRGIWAHLGWNRVELEPGRSVFEWVPTTDHAFPTIDGGWIVHGGMVTALLDSAMGAATWSLLNNDEVFLTADLRTEFYRPTPLALVRGTGLVVHKTRKITFCQAELHDANGALLASCRGTNVTLDLRERGSRD